MDDNNIKEENEECKDNVDVTEGVYKIKIQNELGQNIEHKITHLDEKNLNINKFDEQVNSYHQNETIQLQENDNLSILRVDYVPKGKIITLSVSFMW